MSRTTPRDRGNPSALTAARLAAGLTQVQLAEAIGCNDRCLYRWEHGKAQPRPETLFKLAKILNCDPEKLL